MTDKLPRLFSEDELDPDTVAAINLRFTEFLSAFWAYELVLLKDFYGMPGLPVSGFFGLAKSILAAKGVKQVFDPSEKAFILSDGNHKRNK